MYDIKKKFINMFKANISINQRNQYFYIIYSYSYINKLLFINLIVE